MLISDFPDFIEKVQFYYTVPQEIVALLSMRDIPKVCGAKK